MVAGAPGLIKELGAIPDDGAGCEPLHPPVARMTIANALAETHSVIRIILFRLFMPVIVPLFWIQIARHGWRYF